MNYKKIIIGIITFSLLLSPISAISGVSTSPSGQQTINMGATQTYTITLMPQATVMGDFSVDVSTPDANIGIVIRDDSGTLATGDGSGLLMAHPSYVSGVSKTIYVDITNIGVGSSSVKDVTILADDGYPQTDVFSFTTSIVVPEFPAIALPIATILGLMFIINSRKKKE